MNAAARVREYLMALQERLAAWLESIDGSATFRRDEIQREGGGLSRPWVLEAGAVCEPAAVNFTPWLEDAAEY